MKGGGRRQGGVGGEGRKSERSAENTGQAGQRWEIQQCSENKRKRIN